MSDPRTRAPFVPCSSRVPAPVPSDPRAPGDSRAGRASRRRGGPTRRLLRVTLCTVPWLVLGAACFDSGENGDGDDDTSQGGSDVVGQATAGASGMTPMGVGGTMNPGVMTSVGGSGGAGGAGTGGSSAVGGSSSALGGGAGGDPGSLPAEPGETGIFVGMTAAHNVIRAELNLNPPLPDLTWSEDLAQFAQQWADNLANGANCGTIFHRDQRMYGENIAFRGSSRLTTEYAPEEAVESWAAEVECWEYGTILGNNAPNANSESCDPTCIAAQHSSGCGHYTQLVWRNTREVGCGYAQCKDGNFTDEIWVCNYSPPGNFIGQTPY
jgi:pathogenesis-related protein 1